MTYVKNIIMSCVKISHKSSAKIHLLYECSCVYLGIIKYKKKEVCLFHSKLLANVNFIEHAFFGRAGGVSTGNFSSLNS